MYFPCPELHARPRVTLKVVALHLRIFGPPGGVLFGLVSDLPLPRMFIQRRPVTPWSSTAEVDVRDFQSGSVARVGDTVRIIANLILKHELGDAEFVSGVIAEVISRVL